MVTDAGESREEMSMATATLKWVDADHGLDPTEDVMAEARRDLASRLQAAFEYPALSDSVNRATRRRQAAFALKGAGLKVLHPDDVEAYKVRTAHATRGKLPDLPLGKGLCVLSAVAALVLAFEVAHAAREVVLVPAAITAFAAFLTGIICCVEGAVVRLSRATPRDWRRCDLPTRTRRLTDRMPEDLARMMRRDGRGPAPAYSRPIPEWALSRALAAKESLDAADVPASFHVDALMSQEEWQAANPPMMDPFLVVTAGGSDFYLAAWDEPSFAGRSIVPE
jgi:hypothetical protein